MVQHYGGYQEQKCQSHLLTPYISILVSMITGSTKLIDVVHHEQSAHVATLLSVGIVHKNCLILEYDATISMRMMDNRPYSCTNADSNHV